MKCNFRHRKCTHVRGRIAAIYRWKTANSHVDSLAVVVVGEGRARETQSLRIVKQCLPGPVVDRHYRDTDQHASIRKHHARIYGRINTWNWSPWNEESCRKNGESRVSNRCSFVLFSTRNFNWDLSITEFKKLYDGFAKVYFRNVISRGNWFDWFEWKLYRVSIVW